MFDLATRYAPNNPQHAGLAIPFDWRLVDGANQSLPYNSFQDPCASVVPAVTARVLQVFSLRLEDTLQTAIIISLFTDKRAGKRDVLPANQTDKRGWVGDEYQLEGAWGSTLWLLYYAHKSEDLVMEHAKFSAQEALAWMVRDGLADRLVVEAEWHGNQRERLALRIQIYQPDTPRPVYDVLWGTSIMRGESVVQVSGGRVL